MSFVLIGIDVTQSMREFTERNYNCIYRCSLPTFDEGNGSFTGEYKMGTHR